MTCGVLLSQNEMFLGLDLDPIHDLKYIEYVIRIQNKKAGFGSAALDPDPNQN